MDHYAESRSMADMNGGHHQGGYVMDTGIGHESSSQPSPSTNTGKQQRDQTVMPLTAKQLAHDLHSDLETYTMMGKEIVQAHVVGVITAIDMQNTYYEYTIHDGTGELRGQSWVETTPSEAEQARRNALRVGIYVEAYAMLRVQNGKPLLFHKIRPITDPNAIVHHFLSCMVAFQRLRKAANAMSTAPTAGAADFGSNPFAAAASSSSSSSSSASSFSNFNQPAAHGVRSNLPWEQQRVLQVFSSGSFLQSGAHVNQAVHELRSELSEEQVHVAVRALVREGHLVELTENYYRAANQP